MMTDMDFEAWRCKHDDNKFCPDEGCPKYYGCARMKGWQPGQPTPEAIIRGPRWMRENGETPEDY